MKNNYIFQQEKTIFWILKFVLAAYFTFIGLSALAQDIDEPESEIRQLSGQERTRLQEILNKPIDLGALKIDLERLINEKIQAAMQLGDRKAEEEAMQLALEHIATPGAINNVARIERDKHNYAKAVELHKKSLNLVGEIWKPFYMAHIAYDYHLWWKNADSEEWISNAKEVIARINSNRMNQVQQRAFLRSQRFVYWVLSLIERRNGRLPQAIDASDNAEKLARRAYQIQLPSDKPIDRTSLTNDVSQSLALKVFSYRSAGRLVEAENALRDYLRFAKEVDLTPLEKSGIYQASSSLRIAQRDFVQAQRFGDKSLELFLAAGRKEYEVGARNRMSAIAAAYAGQLQWDKAQQYFDRIDQSFKERRTINNAPYPFDRGYVALGRGQFSDAVTLFDRVRKSNIKTFGEGHYFVAQSSGLQGVALWRQDKLELREQALSLLEAAVSDLVHPKNADFLDSFAYRPEIRQTIISTYIEALLQTRSPQIANALGLADWLKAGTTQEAMADAAVRAAAQTQGLADLVRQEQDAKNEIKGLRDYLSGQAGNAQSTLPEIAAQMRERINALEKNRLELQSKIKAAFPGYERLVRPLPPQIDEIAKALQPSEALIFLMPEIKGVHVWAVTTKGGQPDTRHHWVDWPLQTLTKDIAALRQPLEALGETGTVKPFPNALALTLYQKLLAPLAGDLKGQSQWIIAASGPLARIPFSLLQVQAAQGSNSARWLIDQVALTHVPNVGSWLSLRSLPRNVKPDQPLLAWGDPSFKPAQAINSVVTPSASVVRAVRSAPKESDTDLEKDIIRHDNLYHEIPPLPETREELIQLARALQASPSDLILGSQATRMSVLNANKSGVLQRKRVLVFATHGLMVGELPGLAQPALAMAANGEETRNPLSPLLTLEDVLGLKLNSDWVVLSACNTAAGDGKGEEALSGLARGFFYAGSRSMLVTHWAVESESAKELTTKTFAHFTQSTSAPKAESLRQAIIQVKADPRYSHPVFWAPYVLVGDSLR
ncbi:MAG: hypothetical protein RLZZ596_1733 [Pseudomonadota bacterium]|jgi:CHAT domain-containing protein